MAVISGGVVSSAVPHSVCLSSLPIPRRRSRQGSRARSVGAGLAAKFADKGLDLLAIDKQGFRSITNSKHPIPTHDIKGLKIRVISNEIYPLTFKALGAEVIPMNLPRVYAAMKDVRLHG